MGREWRLFFRLPTLDPAASSSIFNLWTCVTHYIPHLAPALQRLPVEKRTDIYYNLQRPDLGLKERGGRSPYLELKVREKRGKFGIESWKKVFAKSVAHANLTAPEILAAVSSSITSSVHAELAKAIDSVSRERGDLSHTQFAVNKRRQLYFLAKEKAGHFAFTNLTLEQTDFELVHCADGADFGSFRSVCVEGEHEMVQRFVKNVICPEQNPKLTSTKVYSCGYPGFILRVCSGSNADALEEMSANAETYASSTAPEQHASSTAEN